MHLNIDKLIINIDLFQDYFQEEKINIKTC
jgi:hypothetical protein